MSNLSQIKADSNWGDASNTINTNFQNMDVEVEKLKNSTTRFKGYFTNETNLKNKFPSPKRGDIAFVGEPYPGNVYDVLTDGSWHNTTKAPETGSVDLQDYVTKDDFEASQKEQDDKLTELDNSVKSIENYLGVTIIPKEQLSKYLYKDNNNVITYGAVGKNISSLSFLEQPGSTIYKIPISQGDTIKYMTFLTDSGESGGGSLITDKEGKVLWEHRSLVPNSENSYNTCIAPNESAFFYYTVAYTIKQYNYSITITSTNSTISEKRITHKILLQAGSLGGDDQKGLPWIVVDTDSRNLYFRSWHTPMYIQFNADNHIYNIKLEDGETFVLLCYDENLNYIGQTSSTVVFPKTSYIKILITKNTAYEGQRILNITTDISDFVYVKNTEYDKSLYTRDDQIFTYEVNCNPYIPYTVDANSEYMGNNERYCDNGYIYLPPNYNPFGEAVPLIIFVHGTNEFVFTSVGNGATNSYGEYIKFLTLNGYAVADCCGLTDKWGLDPQGDRQINTKISPVGIACFSSMYEFVLRNYNIRADGCFIYGKSAGGLITEWFMMHNVIPIKAAAGLAPSTDLIGSDITFGCANYRQIQFYLELFGVPREETEENITNEIILDYSQFPYLVSKKELLIGYDPMAMGSTLDYDAYLLALENREISSSLGRPRPVYDENVLNIANKAVKYSRCPYKIWHSKDDDSVLYATSEMFINMLRRGGSIAELRTMPDGTGKHYSMDSDPKAIKTNYKTKYGGTVNTSVGYAEMVDWFNRWM